MILLRRALLALATAVALLLPAFHGAHAAAPTFVAAGAVVAGNGAISPAWPAGHQANDIGLMLIQTSNQTIGTTPAGWAQITSSPQGTGTAGAAGATRLTVLWKRATSNAEATLSIGDSGNHQIARILVFRGVTTTGNPWDVTVGATAASSTAVSVPGSTTTVPDTMVVAIMAHANDATSTTRVTGWTNASLASVTEAADNATNAGTGGGFGAAYGVKTTAGAYNATTATLAAASVKGLISIALKPPIMTLGDGTDPGNASIGPGGAATMADAFTFVTTDGSNTVTDVTVGLAAGTSGGLSLVEITNDAGTVVYGSVANPASDTPTITLSTNTLTATTTLTQYKIRVTPKTHANMPVPPGSTYLVTAQINSWSSTFSQMGSDTAGPTITIDNQSPANVSGASCTAGAGQNSLAWTNPADGDFNSVIVLRNTSAISDTPVEGTSYAVSSTIGTSTVVCSTAGTSCSDTGLTVGTGYHYKIFARDTNVNWSSGGVVPTGSPCTPTPSSFNVVETGASATAGRLFTKIAGQNIVADIVALDASSAIATGFTGAVTVELVDNTSGGACAGLPQIKALADETFTGGNSGRHPLSAGQLEANAWRNVKFRIKFPTASPTVTSCSSDNFAIRPLQFVSLQARDLNRTTAGTTRTLSNTANPGTGNVHNAGQPFRIDATAQNGAGSPATTTNYAPDPGQPVAVLSQCGVAAVCPASPGTLTTGTFSAASGVITSTTASYNDVGAFDLALEDRTFASVDAADGTSTAVRYIPSGAALTVGRFVPDRFTLEPGSSITPRSDIGACSGSSFTYLGERMDLVFTLKARDSAGNVTANYAGATLGALSLTSGASYSFGAIDSAAPTLLTARLDTSLISGIVATWSAGSASITAPLAVSRNAAPDGPFGSLKLGIAPSDPDGVTLQASALNLDADNSGSAERAQIGASTAARFGRLRLQNAQGSEKLDLPIPLTVQHWNGTAFVTNAADSCTSLSSANLSLGSYAGGISGTNMGASHISLGAAFASGVGSLKLTKPSPVPTTGGSTRLTVDLTAEAKSYLKGNWGVATYTADPTARASFGVYGSQPRSIIFNRENY